MREKSSRANAVADKGCTAYGNTWQIVAPEQPGTRTLGAIVEVRMTNPCRALRSRATAARFFAHQTFLPAFSR